jgi:hypothetical protein
MRQIPEVTSTSPRMQLRRLYNSRLRDSIVQRGLNGSSISVVLFQPGPEVEAVMREAQSTNHELGTMMLEFKVTTHNQKAVVPPGGLKAIVFPVIRDAQHPQLIAWELLGMSRPRPDKYL